MVCEVHWTRLLDHVWKGFLTYNIRDGPLVPLHGNIRHPLLTRRGAEAQIDLTLLVENLLTFQEMTVDFFSCSSS